MRDDQRRHRNDGVTECAVFFLGSRTSLKLLELPKSELRDE